MRLESLIRSVPNFPKEGIIFKDITTLLQSAEGLNDTINQFVELAKDKGITKVVGIESRGFIFGGAIAQKINAGFVPVRKPGKLPSTVICESYELEYGTDIIEIHNDAIEPGDKVLMHDDLLATGGTMEAACKLVEKLGGEIIQISFLIELSFLKGREKLSKYDVQSLIFYSGE
jgi:adenine phosphoribosyltransferase